MPNGIGLTTPINLDGETKGAMNKLWTISLEKALYIILILATVFFVGQLIFKMKKEKINWKKQYKLYIAVFSLVGYHILLTVSETVRFALNFTDVPVVTGLLIGAVGLAINFLSRTKLGSDIHAVGQSQTIAVSMGCLLYTSRGCAAEGGRVWREYGFLWN